MQKRRLEVRRRCGPTPVARGGSGAKAPPLAARLYVASSPDSPLPHLFDGHKKLVASSAAEFEFPGQQGHVQVQFGILGEVPDNWKCLPTKRQD